MQSISHCSGNPAFFRLSASIWFPECFWVFYCGEEFVIGHDPAFADKKVAEKQSGWLEKVLAEEHERDCLWTAKRSENENPFLIDDQGTHL
jgi:hypothetical protein